ncbi:MAG: hypothetical protein AAF790_04755 [Planctomycetota bacterium]
MLCAVEQGCRQLCHELAGPLLHKQQQVDLGACSGQVARDIQIVHDDRRRPADLLHQRGD